MEYDLHSFGSLLNSFNGVRHTPQGKQLHLFFLKRGILNVSLNLTNRLLQMYTRCAQMGDAQNLFDEMTQRNVFTWNTLLEGYMKCGRIKESIEMFRSMPSRNAYSWNVMIPSLARAGELSVARGLFNEMPHKNVISLNSLMHGYVRNGCPHLALSLFKDYLNWDALRIGDSLCLDTFVLTTAIGACADLGGLDFGKQIHGSILLNGVEFDSVLGSSLVHLYSKCGDVNAASHVMHSMQHMDDFALSALITGYANCGRMDDALKIFHLRSDHCVVLWNSLIAGYIINDEPLEALLLFNKMRNEGVVGDSSTFTSILSACSSVAVVEICQQLHCDTCKLGLIEDLIVASALIDTYAKCGRPFDACALYDRLEVCDTVLQNSMISIYSSCGRIDDAKMIFKNMNFKNLISWNSMIVGLSQNGCPIEALDIFCDMNRRNLSMDRFSLASVISACASISSRELGEQVFARATRICLDYDQIVVSSLIDFYCKCGFVENGRKLFDQTEKQDAVLWNSIIIGYAMNDHGYEALNLFDQMRYSDVFPTNITFTGVLSACNHCGLIEEAQKWFIAMKYDYHIDPGIEHYSCMVDLFARAGCLEEAIDLIKRMPFNADTGMWSTILRGCVAHGNRTLGKTVVDQIISLDPENSAAFVQLSNMLAISGDWGTSAFVRKMMRDNDIQKNPGLSWGSA